MAGLITPRVREKEKVSGTISRRIDQQRFKYFDGAHLWSISTTVIVDSFRLPQDVLLTSPY